MNWLKEVLWVLSMVAITLLVMMGLGIIFIELLDLLARFIIWLGPNPFFIWLL